MGIPEKPRIVRGDPVSNILFNAMASPCELLVESADKDVLATLAQTSFNEVKRIEARYSRYLKDNLCYAINNANGEPVQIDDECYRLLNFADECFRASDGLFDLTSGVLRKVWHFDGSSKIPDQSEIDKLKAKIGWEKVTYDFEKIQMPAGMEIDFGGIGKEYAVDKVASICLELNPAVSVVVNFGGDIQITRPRQGNKAWAIGIENPQVQESAKGVINIVSGALATSGDARRFLLHKGQRYSHILNPQTGWPVSNAPRSVTVAAAQCIQAGCLATIALLQGPQAEEFLDAQHVKYWCIRE